MKALTDFKNRLINSKILLTPSRLYTNLCHDIGNCHSQEEEQLFCNDWAEKIKDLLDKPNLPAEDMMICCKSIIHLSYLGYDTSFGDMTLLSLTQNQDPQLKAIGYFACSVLYDSSSPLSLMVLYSAQKDLDSSDETSILLSLITLSNMPTVEVISTVIGAVIKCLSHPKSSIRKHALMTLHSFLSIDPKSIIPYYSDIVYLLHDDNLSVMNAAILVLTKFLDLSINNEDIKNYTEIFFNIALQISARHISSEYFFHDVPHPFAYVHALRALRKLAPFIDDPKENIIPFLDQTMLKFINVGSAPSAAILKEAMKCCLAFNNIESPEFRASIGAFMKYNSDSHHYIGLKFLQEVPSYSLDLQEEVINCMQSPDPSIYVETLELLSYMATHKNIQIIIDSLFDYFPEAPNFIIKEKIASKIPPLAVKYAPSPIWFANTMEKLFKLAGNTLSLSTALIVNKSIDSSNNEMKKLILEQYIETAGKGTRLSDVFVSVISHMIGCYAQLLEKYDLEFCSLLMCDLADDYPNVRYIILMDLFNLTSIMKEIPSQVADLFVFYENSSDIKVQEICSFALHLPTEIVKSALDPDIQFDSNLSFLDKYVETHKTKDYVPLSERGCLPDSLHIQESSNLSTVEGQENPSENKDSLDTSGLDIVWGPEGIDVPSPFNQAKSIYDPESLPKKEKKKNSLFEELSTKKKSHKVNKKTTALLNAFKDAFDDQMTSHPTSIDENGELLIPDDKKGVYDDSYEVPFEGIPGETVYSSKIIPDDIVYRNGKIIKNPQSNTTIFQNESVDLDYSGVESVWKAEDDGPVEEKIPQQYTRNPLIPIYKDKNIHVGYWIEKGEIVVAIQNISSRNFSDFSYQLEIPNGIQGEIEEFPEKSNNLFNNSYAWVRSITTITDPSISKLGFKLQIGFDTIHLVVGIPSTIIDYIVPYPISTKEYGSLWTQGGKTQNFIIPKGKAAYVTPIEEISAITTQKMHFSSIQRIKEEEIFAAKIIGVDYITQLHIKRSPTKISVKVMTQSEELTKLITSAIPSFIKNE